MTIVVAAASPDGIVLAADSRTTWADGGRHRIGSDYADKVFELDGKFGVATYGYAFIGDRTINGLMDQFMAGIGDKLPGDVDGFAAALGGFFEDRFLAEYEPSDEEGWPLGFIVVGYDEEGIGRAREVGIGGNPSLVISETDLATNAGGAVLWRGQTDVIARLIKGVDWGMLGVSLSDAGVNLADEHLASLERLEYILIPPMTLQDAADMAAFLVRTTVDMQRFSDGTSCRPGLIPGCGGATQILVVKTAGVDWVARRGLLSPTSPGRAEGSAEFGA